MSKNSVFLALLLLLSLVIFFSITDVWKFGSVLFSLVALAFVVYTKFTGIED